MAPQTQAWLFVCIHEDQPGLNKNHFIQTNITHTLDTITYAKQTNTLRLVVTIYFETSNQRNHKRLTALPYNTSIIKLVFLKTASYEQILHASWMP